VTVNDNQAPAITCKPAAVRTTPNSKYSVHGHEFDATASDGCGVSSLIYSLSGATVKAFDDDNRSVNNVKLNIGTTTITWKATDVNGNSTTCTTEVTVLAGSLVEEPVLSKVAPDSQSPAPFTVRVMPNPTSNYFTLALKSESYEKFKISVTDVSGRLMEQRPDVPANSTLQLGNKYRPGVYIAEIYQGKNKVVLRLIKEGN